MLPCERLGLKLAEPFLKRLCLKRRFLLLFVKKIFHMPTRYSLMAAYYLDKKGRRLGTVRKVPCQAQSMISFKCHQLQPARVIQHATHTSKPTPRPDPRPKKYQHPRHNSQHSTYTTQKAARSRKRHPMKHGPRHKRKHASQHIPTERLRRQRRACIAMIRVGEIIEDGKVD